MALRFHGITVPISIVLASLYFYWITTKSAKAKGKGGNAVDIVVHKTVSGCKLKATKGDLVHLHYTGYAKTTGQMVESSREKSEPYVFKLGTCNEKTKPECIKGFMKGVDGMCVGEKRKVTIPPHLAFGKQGRGKDIRPDETLIYHIEMVDIDSFN
eukprot:TRINITY_DN8369_c0_g1_i1.p2 TRINITY_DN8369_c0_g1~~TRINITY_DN8369_c0_g1_i1.p2  ORF type:complete len:179 (-),score=34.49 TRINITY_DN8369_c0_g1_i1:72-539(-)